MMANAGQSFRGHVSPEDGPLMVLLTEDGADQADDDLFVGEDADHVGASLDQLVDVYERFGGVDFAPVILREGHEREDVGFSFFHQFGEPWEARVDQNLCGEL